jgi:type IV secretory pathway TraG/TraD family ATPase VirD4
MGLLTRLLGGSGAPSGPVELDGPAIVATDLVPLTREDYLTVGDLCTGVAIFGATGSGKTSGSGQQIALALLAAGFGGLVLSAKTEERELWERYARMTGRSRDLLFFSPSEGWRFNFLDYEWRRPGAGGGRVENIVRLFTLAMETLGAGEQKATGNNAYWQRAMQELLRNAVALVGMGTGHVTLEDVNRLIASAPRSQAAVDAEIANPTGFCVQLLDQARKRFADDPERLLDSKKVMAYWFGQWPHIPPETRGNILSTFTSATDAFGFSPFRELFCTSTNIAPEMAEYGKIIFLDLNIKEHGKTGQFAQVLFKTCFQNSMERRNLSESPMPVFLWGDEAPYFLTSEDESVLRTARSKRMITVYLMQNLTTLYEALGGHAGRDKAHSILTNLSTQIFHANRDVETNKYAAETIGQSVHMMASYSEGTNYGENWGGSSTTDVQTGGGSVGHSSGQSTGWSQTKSAQEQLQLDVQPKEFTLLRTGGPENGLCVDAIITRTGHIWHNGRNYLPVTFKQH